MKQRHRVTWKGHIGKSLFNIPIPHTRDFHFRLVFAQLNNIQRHWGCNDQETAWPLAQYIREVSFGKEGPARNQPWQGWLLVSTGSVFLGIGGLLERGALLSATLWQNGLRKELPKPLGLTTGTSLEWYIRWHGFYNIKLSIYGGGHQILAFLFQKESLLKILP